MHTPQQLVTSLVVQHLHALHHEASHKLGEAQNAASSSEIGNLFDADFL